MLENRKFQSCSSSITTATQRGLSSEAKYSGNEDSKMASSCLEEFPRASGSGDSGGPARKEPESFCCQLATSTPITHPEEFAKLLDLIVHQSKENDPAAGIVFAFLNFSKSNCLFPLAGLVHFFEAFVPQPIITYLTSDSCLSAAKSIDTILMEAEKSEEGLYKDAKRSCFPSTGRNHFLRLMNASGPAVCHLSIFPPTPTPLFLFIRLIFVAAKG